MSNECKFFIPGPTWVRPAILAEMTRPMIGHRSAEFRELFGRIRRDLKTLFETATDGLVITASGTGVMQAALENCVKRRVIVRQETGSKFISWMRPIRSRMRHSMHCSRLWKSRLVTSSS